MELLTSSIINHYTDFFTNKTSEHGTMDSLSELLAFLLFSQFLIHLITNLFSFCVMLRVLTFEYVGFNALIYWLAQRGNRVSIEYPFE